MFTPYPKPYTLSRRRACASSAAAAARAYASAMLCGVPSAPRPAWQLPDAACALARTRQKDSIRVRVS